MPTWGAARPTPSAARMVSTMSSISACISGEPTAAAATGLAGVRRAGWPRRTIGRIGMAKYTAAARAAPRRGGRRSRRKAHGIVLIMAEEQATGGRRERRRRWLRGLLVGTAIGVPALAHFLIQRRARPPRPPRWGRGRRYAGRYGDIAFQFLGEGDSIVLLHSLGPGHDVAEWEGAAEILAERFAVYALDLPGWGRSAAPAAYRPSAYAEAIEDFLDGVVREPAVVVAAGLSAGYALAVAARRPELVRALGLVGPEGLEAETRMGRRAGAAPPGVAAARRRHRPRPRDPPRRPHPAPPPGRLRGARAGRRRARRAPLPRQPPAARPPHPRRLPRRTPPADPLGARRGDRRDHPAGLDRLGARRRRAAGRMRRPLAPAPAPGRPRRLRRGRQPAARRARRRLLPRPRSLPRRSSRRRLKTAPRR